jgi:EmrB/QacA subfamily drug resistance transporter
MSHIVKPPCDEGVIQTGKLARPATGVNGTWVLVATILGSSMAFIDGTVVNVALPVLQTELKATVADVQWVVEAYALFLSALILVGGSLGDHFGRKRIYAIGIAAFTLSSVVCGFAPNITLLIAARAIQGIGGALLVPGSLAIISASFEKEQRGRAIGTWSGFTSITSAIGPVLGGVLVQYASWRWVFFINVPMAAIVLTILFLRVPDSRDEEEARQRLDWLGALLATIGLGGVVYGLIEANNVGLGDPQVLLAIAIGIVALVAFLLVEARSQYPMVPLQLFRSPTFSGANLLTLLLYAALGGALFFVPFNLIRVQGYTPTAAGAANLPFIIIMFTLSRWSGGLVTRYGAKLPLIIGPIIAAAGFMLFALPGVGGTYWTTFFPAVVVLGIGMAISVAPLTTAVMGAVDARRSGIASGINNAVARTAGLLAVAMLGLVALAIFSVNLDSQVGTLPISPGIRALLVAQQSKLVGIAIPNDLSSSAQAAVQQVINQSFVSSFRVIMLIATAMALISALSSFLLIEGKRPSLDSQESRSTPLQGTTQVPEVSQEGA